MSKAAGVKSKIGILACQHNFSVQGTKGFRGFIYWSTDFENKRVDYSFLWVT